MMPVELMNEGPAFEIPGPTVKKIRVKAPVHVLPSRLYMQRARANLMN